MSGASLFLETGEQEMQLRALEQIHLSAVQADTIRPGQIFDISDSAGGDLLKKHPSKFEMIDSGQPDHLEAAEKTEPEPQNKAEPAPANKADKKAKDEK
jgi:hypothetical protein